MKNRQEKAPENNRVYPAERPRETRRKIYENACVALFDRLPPIVKRPRTTKKWENSDPLPFNMVTEAKFSDVGERQGKNPAMFTLTESAKE
jgi:hypothetical protein